jgi:hypothetical protein
MQAEGWYRDPFEIHTDRWFSDGRPTALVRDGKVEGQDPPPEVAYSGPLVEATTSRAVDGEDLRRADEAEAGGAYDPKAAREAALDTIPWGPLG